MTAMPPLHRLKVHEDARGKLVAIEGPGDIPFAIGRVYYIVAGDGSSRGFHAHRTLQQVMMCVHGSCRVVLDDGRARSEYSLDRPDEALAVGPMTWREMHDFSPGAVLLVLASDRFDEDDYIRDYDVFVREATGGAA